MLDPDQHLNKLAVGMAPRYIVMQPLPVQSSTVQYSLVWYSIVQFSVVQYSIVQYGIVQYGIVQYGIVQYGIVQYGIVQYSLVWYSILYSIVWYSMVWYSIVQYITVQKQRHLSLSPFCRVITAMVDALDSPCKSQSWACSQRISSHLIHIIINCLSSAAYRPHTCDPWCVSILVSQPQGLDQLMSSCKKK